MSKRLAQRLRADSGSALAMVLLMVIVLGLWLGSIAVLTQSSQKAINQNVANSQRRSDLVSGALTQAVRDLTFDGGGGIHRWGVDWNDASGNPQAAKCDNGDLVNLADYVASNGDHVRIQCTQKLNSGKIFPMASFVLTGTGVWKDKALNSVNCGTSCVTGQDGGLDINYVGTRDCTASSTAARLEVTGGILNSSGAFTLSGRDPDMTTYCAYLSLGSLSSSATVTMPDVALNNCPAALRFGGSCACPYSYKVVNGAVVAAPDCAAVPAADVDPANDISDLKAYLDSVSAGLQEVSGATAGPDVVPGTSTPQSCTNPDVTTYGAANPVVTWLPGRVTDAALLSLNALTTSGCSYGGKPVTVVLSPGVYRFGVDGDNATACAAATPSPACPGTATTATSTTSSNTFNIKLGTVIVGTPVVTGGAITGCSTTSPGAQLQFSNATYMRLVAGTQNSMTHMFACPPDATSPVIAAPLPGAPASFSWYGNRTSAFYTSDKGNASALVVQGEIKGMVFAPGGWGDLGFNGDNYTLFGSGAVFRAMSVTGTGNATSGGSVAPPPPFNGDRVVQLRFWDVTNNSDLGVVQVVIRDYFGRRLSYAFRTILWRTAW